MPLLTFHTQDDKIVGVRVSESELLVYRLLASQPYKVFSLKEIEQTVWRCPRAIIMSLRRKLAPVAPSLIVTRTGFGYSLRRESLL